MVNPLDHPLPERVSHWINLINFLILGITGYLIHDPVPGVPLSTVRYLHFIFMYLLVVNGIVRFYLAIFGKHKDYKNFVLDKRDWRNLIPQVKYYLFMGKRPATGKYNPLQKLAYLMMPVLAALQVITGLILYLPTKMTALAEAFGGLGAVRGIHYVILWLFMALVLAHAYLVFTEAREQFWLMFCGKTGRSGVNETRSKAA